MSKISNNRDNRPTDPENLTEFLLKRGCIVHKNPVNKYMNFILKEGNKLEKKKQTKQELNTVKIKLRSQMALRTPYE